METSISEMTHNEKLEKFNEIALPLMDALYRTALRLTRNEKDAEDLLQETFLRAFKSFHQFTLGTNIKAWMFKILTNLHINRYQKQARRPNKVSYDDMEEFYLYDKILDDFGSAEEEIIQNLFDYEVKEAIEELPYDFRITVLLADIEGFHYKEIAQILDCPIGTVRSRLSRGRRILQRHLWDYAKNKRIFGKSCKVSNCKEAVENLVDYIKNDIDQVNRNMVKDHLNVCQVCCDRIDFEEKLQQTIKEKAAAASDTPGKLKEDIMSHLNRLI